MKVTLLSCENIALSSPFSAAEAGAGLLFGIPPDGCFAGTLPPVVGGAADAALLGLAAAAACDCSVAASLRHVHVQAVQVPQKMLWTAERWFPCHTIQVAQHFTILAKRSRLTRSPQQRCMCAGIRLTSGGLFRA